MPLKSHLCGAGCARLFTRSLIGLLLLATGLVPAQAASRRESPPNVIFIILDDLGPADLGCYGSKAIQTPHIDRLAAEGMRFTQAYAGCSVCGPTRSVLMTGMHGGRTTVRGNSGGIPLRAEDITIAQVLQPAGYVSGGFGKWGIGDVDTDGVPERHGFTRFFGYYHQVHAHQFYPNELIDTGRKVTLPNAGFYDVNHPDGAVPTQNPKGGTFVFSAYRIFDEMKRFLREQGDRPFFCYAPWTMPHARREIPDDDPAWLLYKDMPWSGAEKGHAAYVSLADRFVGETIALLRERGLEERTLVFVCSDNGAPNTSKNLQSSGQLRGLKGEMFEGGIRIPLIARWPGRIKPGAASDTPVTVADIMPTLAELAGPAAKLPPRIDGTSLVPELLGTGKLPQDRTLYWEWNGAHFAAYAPKFQAVRRGEWKIVRHQLDGPWELYRVTSDVTETKNLAASHPDIAAALSKWAEQNREPHRPQIEPTKPEGRKWR